MLFEQIVSYMLVVKKASNLIRMAKKHGSSDEIVIKMGNELRNRKKLSF